MDKLLLPNPYPGLHEWNSLLAYRGSISHNTHLEENEDSSTDDIDLVALCITPLEYYFGLADFGNQGTEEIGQGTKLDIVIYEARKYVRLMAKGNANVLSSLWLRDDHYLHLDDSGKMLIENRYLFVGKHVYESFVGYANMQRHKMTHLAYQGYMGDKRRGLVDRFGYDTKNAAHLIRLLRMLIEFLGSGELQVYRTVDSEELKNIKRGSWTLEAVQREADRLLSEAKVAYQKSNLPPHPARAAIDSLLIDMISARLLR